MRSMLALRGIAFVLSLLLLAACARQDDPAPPVFAPIEQGDGRLRFEGMQPCADCQGIRTELVLLREQGEQNYVLNETYLAPQPVPFVSRGDWRREAGFLHLESEDGARLVYAVVDGGRLQPRDGRGRRLAGSDGDGLLSPTEGVDDAGP